MKKRNRTLTAVLLAFTLLLTPGMAAAESVEADHSERGVTRAEFVSMVNQMLQLQETNGLASSFVDVLETDPLANEIQMARYAGFVRGDGTGRFFPGAMITREEAAAMVGRFLPATGARTMRSLEAFSDAGQVSVWARDEIAVLVNKGYLRGRTNGTLAPGDPLTRAEAEQILARVEAAETIVAEDLVLDSDGAGLRDGIFTGMIVIKGQVGMAGPVFENCSVLGPVIRLVGTVSEQDVRRIVDEIAARMAGGVGSVEEAVREGVRAVKPKTSVFTDESGVIVAEVPREKRKRPTVHVTGISLAPPVVMTFVGATHDATITANVLPDTAANKIVVWESGNTAVATVDNGVLTLSAQGTATISAITVDGGHAAQALVSVMPTAEARAYWSFLETLNSTISNYVEGVDLSVEEDLLAAEGMFVEADCPLQRMANNLPPRPGKEEFLAYYFTPIVERIVAARAAFEAGRV